ncbi:TetR/AcrR family transcriptional regulator [Pontibacter toksunensis]|uniref:TetR/AcrR family transcriptional regulator n=2 Tax=Pontibacter toksunensis TaxID=1332631 RepID=A0ABW6BN80_9BACT
MEPVADKKKAILESTLELVKENGFHGTPMSMVAKKAGVAAGTIYHYFDSKDRLICELYSYVRQQSIQAIVTVDDTTLPYQERFFAIWWSLYSFYINNPNVLRFFEQFVNSPYNAKMEEIRNDEFHKLLYCFFRGGIEQGHLRPVNPEILGVLVHGSIITTAKVYGSGKIPFGDEELKQIAQILWDGISVQ